VGDIQITQHAVEIAVQILQLGKIRTRESEMDECVLNQIFAQLSVIAGKLQSPDSQSRVTREKQILVSLRALNFQRLGQAFHQH